MNSTEFMEVLWKPQCRVPCLTLGSAVGPPFPTSLGRFPGPGAECPLLHDPPKVTWIGTISHSCTCGGCQSNELSKCFSVKCPPSCVPGERRGPHLPSIACSVPCPWGGPGSQVAVVGNYFYSGHPMSSSLTRLSAPLEGLWLLRHPAFPSTVAPGDSSSVKYSK